MPDSHPSRLEYPLMPQLLRLSAPQAVISSPSVSQRNHLDAAIVESVRKALPNIRQQIGDMFLPAPAFGISLKDLELETRTYNCLARAGMHEDLQVIARFRISDLLRRKNFGVRCLIDVFASLDSVRTKGIPERHSEEPESAKAVLTSSLSSSDIKTACRYLWRRTNVPHNICQRPLPKLPDGLKFGRHDLNERTYNSLRRVGLSDRLDRLSGKSINELLSIPGLGKNSLIDLLKALQPFVQTIERGQKYGSEDAHRLAEESKLLENLAGAESISRDDPRLGKLLRLIDPQAKNAAEAAERLLSGTHAAECPTELIEGIRQLREQVGSLSNLKIEEELRSIVTSGESERNLEIFTHRYGLDGNPPRTLQEVADNWGLTRERVRQICDRASRLGSRRPFAPLLDRALRLIVQRPPGMASEIESLLTARGISARKFSLESLRSAAMLLGRDVLYSLEDVGGYKTVTAARLVGSGNRILPIAKRAVEHWGAVTIEDVIAKAAEQSAFPSEVVTRVIKGQKDFRWLDESTGWFWLTDVPRNRLRNQIRKVFSVTDEISVSELRAGVRRHHRMQGFAPPERVLIELCKQLRGFSVDARTIKVEKDANWQDLLSETEQVMADILQAHGAVMQREPFEEECIARGVNRTTFYAYLNYSPVITKYATGVYGLRGAKVAPGVVESLKPKKMKGKVLQDYGWTLERRLWVCYQLSESTLMSGVCSTPSALARFVQGEFNLQTPNGTRAGNLGVNKVNTWGLRPFFARKGVDAGDFLVLVYDLDARTAIIHVGDEGLLDEFQPAIEQAS